METNTEWTDLDGEFVTTDTVVDGIHAAGKVPQAIRWLVGASTISTIWDSADYPRFTYTLPDSRITLWLDMTSSSMPAQTLDGTQTNIPIDDWEWITELLERLRELL